MKYIFTTLIFAMLLSSASTALLSQELIQLNFEGILKDEENSIAYDEFLLVVKVLTVQSGDAAMEKSFPITTDNNGWFGFEIGDLNHYFQDQDKTSTISLQLELFPSKNSKWMKQVGDFKVSYKILREVKNDSLLFEITRTDEVALLYSQYDEVLFFRDTYPFVYLQGGFMISEDRISEKLGSLRAIISGDSAASEETTKSRGMKGGFPVGGYRKTR